MTSTGSWRGRRRRLGPCTVGPRQKPAGTCQSECGRARPPTRRSGVSGIPGRTAGGDRGRCRSAKGSPRGGSTDSQGRMARTGRSPCGPPWRAAARFEKVVDRLGHPLPVGPVERLAEIEIRNLPRQSLRPAEVDDPALPGVARRLCEPVAVRVQSDRLADDRRQFHGQDAGTAPDVKESSRAIRHSAASVVRSAQEYGGRPRR